MISYLGSIERRCARNFYQRFANVGCRPVTAAMHPYTVKATLPALRLFSTAPLDDIGKVLPPRFLREADTSNYDAVTLQRNDVPFDADNGKPLPIDDQQTSKYEIESCTLDGDYYHVQWGDGHNSQYAASWIKETTERWHGTQDATTPRIPWSNLTEQKVRADPSLSLTFPDILEKSGMEKALKALYQYGFVLVTDTPIADGGAGVAALASCVSGGSVKENISNSLLASYRSGGTEIMLPQCTEGPLRTLYGFVWSTSSTNQADGASVADSAYGKGSLPLHTDMTYHRDPPGLQIFTMVQPALKGGESVFGDGFAAANFLKKHHFDAFSTLSSVVRSYRCVDEATGWCLEASGPIIATSSSGVVTGIRHNDLDRLPDLPPCRSTREESNAFYEKLAEAHRQWNEVLSRDEFRLVMSLRPGDTVVVANQRCFHARYSFRTDDSCPRAVMGCYVSQDELNSRFRQMGFRLFA